MEILRDRVAQIGTKTILANVKIVRNEEVEQP